MKNAIFLLFLFLALGACTDKESPSKSSAPVIDEAVNDPALFPEGVLVAGTLEQEETDEFELMVKAGSFVYGRVDQQTVDVEVNIYDPAGEKIATFDGPAAGMEDFTFDAELEGTYRIAVKPIEEEEGAYTIQLVKNEPKAESPEARVNQLFSAYDNDFTPGAVVGVIEGGEVTYAKGFGMADLAYDIPFDTDMPSNIGSVSKQFTAMGILLLEKEGLLSLEDDIRRHLPELPQFEHTIRIKNLLNHTNGLREIYNIMPLRGWDGEDRLLREEAINIVKRQPELQAPPGEEFNYNNTAFILLTHVVERLTDQSFPEWMAQNVFQPLGMDNTYIRRDPGHIIPNATQGYASDEDGFRESGDLYAAYGAGGIYTTVGDFAKWMKNFKTAELGGQEVINKLTTPDTLNNGDTLNYALGLSVSEYQGLKKYSHGGADIAHRTMLVYFPEIDKGVVTNSNNANFNPNLANKVIDAFFTEHLEPEEAAKDTEASEEEAFTLETEQLKAFEGKYKSDALGVVVEVKLEDEQLRVEIPGDSPLDLKPTSENTFADATGEVRLTFQKEEEKVKRITVESGEQKYDFEKLADYAPGKKDLQAFAGKYYSKEIETVYTIALKEDQLILQIFGLEDIELTPIKENTFSGSEFFIGEIAFERNIFGRVNAFTVSNGRTKGVAFERMTGL